MHTTNFFGPSFIKAISENSKESCKSIISEPSPGVIISEPSPSVLTFEILQTYFCEILLEEVENYEK